MKKIRDFFQEESGNIWAMMLLFLPIFLIMAGLIFDYGRVVLIKQQIQQIADSAALSGANVVSLRSSDNLHVPTNPSADPLTLGHISLAYPADLKFNARDVGKKVCDQNLSAIQHLLVSGSSSCEISITDDKDGIVMTDAGAESKDISEGAVQANITIKVRAWFLPIINSKFNEFEIRTHSVAAPIHW